MDCFFLSDPSWKSQELSGVIYTPKIDDLINCLREAVCNMWIKKDVKKIFQVRCDAIIKSDSVEYQSLAYSWEIRLSIGTEGK